MGEGFPQKAVLDGIEHPGLTIKQAEEVCSAAKKPDPAAERKRPALFNSDGAPTPVALRLLDAFHEAMKAGHGCASCAYFADRGQVAVRGQCRDARYVESGAVRYGLTPEWEWCSHHTERFRG